MNIEALIPGGIKKTDRWHIKKNDGTCSRCRKEIDEEEVPIMLWSPDGNDMLIYCDGCTSAKCSCKTPHVNPRGQDPYPDRRTDPECPVHGNG